MNGAGTAPGAYVPDPGDVVEMHVNGSDLRLRGIVHGVAGRYARVQLDGSGNLVHWLLSELHGARAVLCGEVFQDLWACERQLAHAGHHRFTSTSVRLTWVRS